MPTLETLPPSGLWTGFYLENHHPRKGWMHLHLMFADVDIHGEGTDYVGPWKITGKINPQSKECQWIKHYLGKHQVRYCGIFGDDGIAGEWDIAKISRGKFHIWPAEMTEIQARYLAEEAANEQRPERT